MSLSPIDHCKFPIFTAPIGLHPIPEEESEGSHPLDPSTIKIFPKKTYIPAGCETHRREYVYPDGRRFIGYLKGGVRHGQGEMHYMNGDIQRGTWEHGLPKGIIKVQRKDQIFECNAYQNGKIYNGEMADGIPHGTGRMQYMDGDYYDGHWFKGKIKGQGIMRCVSGITFVGVWENGFLKTGVKKDSQGNIMRYYGNEGGSCCIL